MATPRESYVQIAPDSTGKKIRNVTAYIIQSDGTPAAMQMQMVGLVDETGKPLDFDVSAILHEIAIILKQIRFGLSERLEIDLAHVKED